MLLQGDRRWPWSGAHVALRGQKTPPQGTQPAALREPGLQLVSEHAGCPCSCLPSLATPSLADATADVVDSASVRFLAASALVVRRKNEAEELARSTEEKVQLLAVPRALRTPEQLRRIDELCAESLARSGMRKRKKRKKKKLPRGRARRRLRQRPLSGYGALVVNFICPDPDRRAVQKTVENPQSSSPSLRRDRFPLQYIDKVLTIWLCSPAGSWVQSCRKRFRSHSCTSFSGADAERNGRDPTVATSMLDTVAHMPVVSQRQVSGMVETVQ